MYKGQHSALVAIIIFSLVSRSAIIDRRVRGGGELFDGPAQHGACMRY